MAGTDIYGVKEKDRNYYEESRENKRRGIKKSSYYHRYFEGYAEWQTEVAPGKTRLVRAYVAPYKKQDITDKDRIMRKILYGLATVFCAAMFIYAGSREAEVNTVWFGAFLGSIQTVIMIFFTASCIRYLFQKKNMTLYRMRTMGYFAKTALVGAAGFLLLTLMAVLCENFQVGIMHLINAVIMLTVFYVEKKTGFLDVENKTKMPANATYIM